jgi:hypothetical protein
MEGVMEVFKKFVTPEQKELAVSVEQKGGNAIIDNEKAMKDLSDLEAKICAPAGMERRKPAKEFNLVEIQHEIRETPTEAIEKNEESFIRKFNTQIRQIQEDIEHTVRQEGDRIISAVAAGPHQRILDPVRIFVGSRNLI